MHVCLCVSGARNSPTNSQEPAPNAPAAFTDLLAKEGLSHKVTTAEHASSCEDTLRGASCQNCPARMLAHPPSSLASHLSPNTLVGGDDPRGVPRLPAGCGGMLSILRGLRPGRTRCFSAPGGAAGPWALSPLLRQLAGI